jgi:putative tryptophan/tyrosine transport system substrate-binding protein
MAIHIRRRDFIFTLGGAAAAWPLGARAQQAAERLRLVGVVAGFSELDMRPSIIAFRNKLDQLGWTEGHNLAVDARLGAGDYQRMTAEAGLLINRNPDVILAQGTPGLTAVRQHSLSVPVVFFGVADPVRNGFIESLARPGGHATGFTNFEFSIGGKWLELLRDASPRLTHVTVISNPANPTGVRFVPFIEDAGRSASIEVSAVPVRGAADIETAVARTAQRPRGGLIVLPDSLAVVHSELLVSLAERHRLPALYAFRVFAAKGGLLSYGLDYPEMYRQAADYVDRILRGSKPSDLPVQAPNKFELVINLKTAKTLGLEVPPTLLAHADEVIE